MDTITIIFIVISALLLLVVTILVILLIVNSCPICAPCVPCLPCTACPQIPICTNGETAVLPLFPPQLNVQGYGYFKDAGGACNVLITTGTTGNINLYGNTVWNCATNNETNFNIKFFYQNLYSSNGSTCTGGAVTYSANPFPIPPNNGTTYIFQAIDKMVFEITYWNTSTSKWIAIPIYINGVSSGTSASLTFTTSVFPIITISNTSSVRADITY